MSWKITKINNATHFVEITHSSGEQLSFTIPNSHTLDPATKNDFIKSKMDARTAEMIIEKAIVPIEAAVLPLAEAVERVAWLKRLWAFIKGLF